MATVIAENLKQVPLPKNTMIVARDNGRLYVVDFTEFPQLDDPSVIDWDISVSKMLIGKVQSTRTSMITVEEIECENIVHTSQFPAGATADFKMTVYGSLDGKNQELQVDPHVKTDEGGYVNAQCRMTAKNFSVMIRGTYNINTLTVTVHNAGRR